MTESPFSFRPRTRSRFDFQYETVPPVPPMRSYVTPMWGGAGTYPRVDYRCDVRTVHDWPSAHFEMRWIGEDIEVRAVGGEGWRRVADFPSVSAALAAIQSEKEPPKKRWWHRG